MKKLLILTAVSLMTFSLMVGCGDKADEATDKVPVETKAADMADSTRMDEMVDSASQMMDSTMADSVDAHAGHDH